jgi:glucan phosphoethanolaminetransferase (alkaline phosphatase superfamily)
MLVLTGKKGKIEQNAIFKILFIAFSVLILIIPDLLVSGKLGALNLCLLLLAKMGLFVFMGLILLRITRSYYLSYLVLGSCYLISSVIEIGNIILLDHYITADNIISLFHATKTEAREFYVLFRLYLIIPIVLVAVFVLVARKYRSISYPAAYQKRLIPLALLVIVTSFALSVLEISNTDKVYSGKGVIRYAFGNNYLQAHPFNLLNETYVLAKNSLRAKKYAALHDSFKFGILNANDTVKPRIVIFIIGERMRYSNWSINGYQRETNPNLRKVKNLISFDKNYSNSNFTYGSIPFIITQATPKTPTLAYSQKTIVSLFKEAGYETTWISSQYLFDIIDDRPNVDHLYELYKKPHTDMDIIPVFDSVISKKTNKNQLIVINMLGGHGGIPPQFNKFSPNNSKEEYPVTMTNAPVFINTYDNIILLQDYVLSQVIGETEKKHVSSVVMFTADHGCNLFDNGKALFGYGSANPTEKETHTPMFVNMSDQFIEKNRAKYNNLLAHKDELTTNNDLFYTLADLANIKYKSFVKEKSISDSSYLEPASRFVYTNRTVFEFKNEKSAKPVVNIDGNSAKKESKLLPE